MKKLLVICLAVAMSMLMAVTSFATEVTTEAITEEVVVTISAPVEPSLNNFVKQNSYEGQFADVSNSAWYYSNVVTAYELGLVKGSSATAFNPTGNITVAETIVLACRVYSIYNGTALSLEASTPWYSAYVKYAMDNGIVKIGQFDNYERAITRAEFAAVLYGSLPETAFTPINNVADNKIPDVSVNDTYGAQIYAFYRAGIVAGNDKYGTYTPDSNIQRCGVAAIVTRMVNPIFRQAFTLEEKPVEVSFISFDQYSVSLTVGGTATLKLGVAPENATDKSVTWTTSNASVATVNDGVITAKGAGTATITATTSNGKTAKCEVTVKEKTVSAFTKLKNYIVGKGIKLDDGDYGWIFDAADIVNTERDETEFLMTYTPSENTITLSCYMTTDSGNLTVSSIIISEGSSQHAYEFISSLGDEIFYGEATINPKTFTDGSGIVFSEFTGLSAYRSKLGEIAGKMHGLMIRYMGSYFQKDGAGVTMADLGYVNF